MGADRNGPCPCGSGKKYKRCCLHKTAAASSRTTLVLLILLILGGALGILVSLTGERSAGGPRRVWSAEHGHWHDLP